MPAVALLLTFVLSSAAAASPPPHAAVVLWATGPSQYGEVSEAMPPRFVLMEDGRVFVGGTSEVFSARLEKKEARAIQKQVDRVRRLVGGTVTTMVTLGPGERMFRLAFEKGPEVLAKGDPAQAPAAGRQVGALIDMLLAFDHPSLTPQPVDAFLLSARETTLPGGCREWTFPVPLAEVQRQPRLVDAAATAGWPTGGRPAVVCLDGGRYQVTLRPLLPGETP